MLAQFDLEYSKYDVRYVNLDVGSSYLVLTDDRIVLQDLENKKDGASVAPEMLERYSALFSALASLLYLPAFFADQGSRIIETKFATGLHEQKQRSMTRKAIKILGASHVPFFRTIRCLVDHPSSASKATLTVQPPTMDFKSSGYWRPLASGEIGEANDGTPIVGKTWVKRTDTWSARSLSSFVVSKTSREIIGPDPGWIYIMRSGSHYDDLYKIGLTRRSSEERSIELSGATGVPTGFEVLAKWAVGDCSKVERESHERLKALRVNKRREFFRGNHQEIFLVINEVVINSQIDA